MAALVILISPIESTSDHYITTSSKKRGQVYFNVFQVDVFYIWLMNDGLIVVGRTSGKMDRSFQRWWFFSGAPLLTALQIVIRHHIVNNLSKYLTRKKYLNFFIKLMMAKSARERKREIKWIGRNDLAGKYPPLMVTDATISITLLGSAHII